MARGATSKSSHVGASAPRCTPEEIDRWPSRLRSAQPQSFAARRRPHLAAAPRCANRMNGS